MAYPTTTYLIHHEEYLGENSKPIEARSHYEAAEIYAKYYNERCDYELFDEEIEIVVAELDGKMKKFKLSAERAIHYNIECGGVVLDKNEISKN